MKRIYKAEQTIIDEAKEKPLHVMGAEERYLVDAINSSPSKMFETQILSKSPNKKHNRSTYNNSFLVLSILELGNENPVESPFTIVESKKKALKELKKFKKRQSMLLQA